MHFCLLRTWFSSDFVDYFLVYKDRWTTKISPLVHSLAAIFRVALCTPTLCHKKQPTGLGWSKFRGSRASTQLYSHEIYLILGWCGMVWKAQCTFKVAIHTDLKRTWSTWSYYKENINYSLFFVWTHLPQADMHSWAPLRCNSFVTTTLSKI